MSRPRLIRLRRLPQTGQRRRVSLGQTPGSAPGGAAWSSLQATLPDADPGVQQLLGPL